MHDETEVIGVPQFFLYRVLKCHLSVRIEEGEFTPNRFDGTNARQVLNQVLLQHFPRVVDSGC